MNVFPSYSRESLNNLTMAEFVDLAGQAKWLFDKLMEGRKAVVHEALRAAFGK